MERFQFFKRFKKPDEEEVEVHDLKQTISLLNAWFKDFSGDEEEIKQYLSRQDFWGGWPSRKVRQAFSQSPEEQDYWTKPEGIAVIYATFVTAQHICGFAGFPEVATKKRYRKASKTPLFRGTLKRDHLAQLLVDYDYHHGTGIAQGIFASNSIDTALVYSGDCLPIEFKLDDSAKTIDYTRVLDYQRLLIDYFHNAKKRNLDKICKENEAEIRKISELYPLFEELKDYAKTEYDMKFVEAIIFEPSTIATLLGYDAINDTNIKIILNRSKMVVEKKEFDRIVDGSKLYDGGVIDFEQKQEEDFLRE